MSIILHTADWHLGAQLADLDRSPEQTAFVEWFIDKARELHPDLILISGDVFDHANPSQHSLQLYYRFLSAMAKLEIPLLVVAGNHDSAPFLDAPRELLKSLGITIVGNPPQDSCTALLELKDAVVCGVPFLREKDVRRSSPGQEEKEIQDDIKKGISQHYRNLFEAAKAIAGERPILATGHLTLAHPVKGSLSEYRETMIGKLGGVEALTLGAFDYLALGHIHSAQHAHGNPNIRYSGSPLPISFSEVNDLKEIRKIEVSGGKITHSPIPVPKFRKLIRLTTQPETLFSALKALDDPLAGQAAWVDLTVENAEATFDIQRQIQDACEPLNVKVIKYQMKLKETLSEAPAPPVSSTLSDLTPSEMFRELMKQKGMDPESPSFPEMELIFAELLESFNEAPSSSAA